MEANRIDRDVTRVALTREAGFSFLELTIASIMLLVLAWLVATLTIDGMKATKFAERQSRVTEIAQDVVDDMRGGLGSAMRVFGNDLVGNAYRNLTYLGSAVPRPLASSRLPLVAASEMFGREDPLLPRTGNELMFARYSRSDEFTASSGITYRVDIYRMERWFLTVDGDGPHAGVPDGLNLSRWVSEPLVDGNQVDRISDPDDRVDVLRHLFAGTPDDRGEAHDEAFVVWLVGDDPAIAGTLRSISSSGTLQTTPPSGRPSWRFEPSIKLCDPDILVYRHHSVASNFAPPVMGVGRFAIMDLPSGFPHGLEVQIVGPAAARQILLHLSIVSTIGGGRRAYHDMQVVVDVRDL